MINIRYIRISQIRKIFEKKKIENQSSSALYLCTTTSLTLYSHNRGIKHKRVCLVESVLLCFLDTKWKKKKKKKP